MIQESVLVSAVDPYRDIRSIAARFGFCDAEYRGELAQIFGGRGRSLRFLRPSGISLCKFGEILWDRRITSRRLDPAEVADLLSVTFDSAPAVKVAKPPTRAAISRAEEKARKMRSRLYQCPDCRQKIRGTRSTLVDCGLCREMHGRTVAMIRVDPLPEELAAMAGAV